MLTPLTEQFVIAAYLKYPRQLGYLITAVDRLAYDVTLSLEYQLQTDPDVGGVRDELVQSVRRAIWHDDMEHRWCHTVFALAFNLTDLPPDDRKDILQIIDEESLLGIDRCLAHPAANRMQGDGATLRHETASRATARLVREVIPPKTAWPLHDAVSSLWVK